MIDEKVPQPHDAATGRPLPDSLHSGPTPSGLKVWRAPRFMVSQVLDTQFSSDPPTSDGTPVSQLS
jgi:hypothetical protein